MTLKPVPSLPCSPSAGRFWRRGGRGASTCVRASESHDGHGEMTAEDVKFTLTTIAKEGSANSLGPEFRLIKSMDIEDPYTINHPLREAFCRLWQQGHAGFVRFGGLCPV